MAQKRLTITLPGSAEALHNALQMLMQYGLISEKKAHSIEGKRKQEESARKPGKKSSWAIVAEEMVQEGLLRGKSEKLLESIRDFRDKESDKESRQFDFMKLPLSERRKIMKKQAEQMAAYYNKTVVEPEE